ncbi:Diguanylate cyclase DosC [Maioricimonas rarisocia]|uniref:diguanylate cyclase n=1 Tax=Maioricimonas rarisocia TaxID=2528026 RepID=A0A517Z5R3_9PLAN|nr:GGDEF domain-containing protein [Maioricimonas rarisocia]QDU37781.1 Diguanylate cyclase DosC [Maioricimonas rarisocia]
MSRRVLHRAILLAAAGTLVGGIAAILGRRLEHPEWATLTALPVVWGMSVLGGWRLALASILAVPVGWWLGRGESAGVAAGHFFAVTGVMAILATFVLMLERMRQVRDGWRIALQTDDLTGLLNRRGFRERLEAELNRARRSGATLAVGLFDCDNFKEVNDTLGHPTGDLLLQCAAEVLTRESRNYDLVARVGGDEFAVAWPSVSASNAERIAQRVHSALSEAVERRKWPASFSFGVVVATGSVSVDDVIRQADEAMYEAKRDGKGRFTVRTVESGSDAAPQEDVSVPA